MFSMPDEKSLTHGPLALRPGAPNELVASLNEFARDADGAFAENTRRALRADLAVFAGWCHEHSRTQCPASPETVAAFVREMTRDRKISTVRRYVSSISTLHRAAQADNPTRSEKVRLALKAVARTAAEKAKETGLPLRDQAEGLTQRDVDRILATTSESLMDRRDLALLLVGRDMLARRSELTAIRVEDLSIADDGTATVTIRQSKTDIAGEGAEQFLGPESTAAVRRWLDAAGIAAGPVFRPVRKGGRVGDRNLAPGEIPAILKRLASRAGIPRKRCERISGHSLRVGMAQDLVQNGADLPGVMQAGRWASPSMPALYTRKLEARRGAVARYHARRHE